MAATIGLACGRLSTEANAGRMSICGSVTSTRFTLGLAEISVRTAVVMLSDARDWIFARSEATWSGLGGESGERVAP